MVISRAKRFGAGTLALLFLALTVRLVWVMATTETGIGIVRLQWQDALGAPIGWHPTPLPKQPAAEQANYWLAATRDLPRAETSAAECMGAAWALDGPSYGYLSTMLEESPWAKSGLSGVPPVGIKQDAAARAEQEFESACATECLRLAAEAVRRDPENVEWRRMQALLQFASPLYSTSRGARSSDWLKVLDAGATADPENALYDYLAALELWRSSADYNYDATLQGDVLTIHIPAQFEEGIRRFERGLEKPRLQFGERGLSAVTAFLETTALSRSDQADVAIHRLLKLRATGVPFQLFRWQTVRGAEAERAGNATAFAAPWQLRIRLTDQIDAGGETFAFEGQFPGMRTSAAKNLLELGEKYPDLLAGADRNELRMIQVEADRRLELLRTASARWPGAKSPTPLAAVQTGFLAAIALRSAVLCACMSLIGWSILRLRKANDISTDRRFALWRHAAAWVVGYGLTWSAALLLPDRPDGMSEVTRTALSLAADSWQWLAIRWTSYYGYYAAIALALTTILLLSLLMYLWRGDWPRFKGELVHAVIRRYVVSLTAVAALWLAVALAVTPTLIHIAEQDFHSKIDYFRDVPAWLEKVNVAVDQVGAEHEETPP